MNVEKKYYSVMCKMQYIKTPIIPSNSVKWAKYTWYFVYAVVYYYFRYEPKRRKKIVHKNEQKST